MAFGASLQKFCDSIRSKWNWNCANSRCCSNNNTTLILGDLLNTTGIAKQILANDDLPTAMKSLSGIKQLHFVEIKQRNLRHVNEQTAAARAGICGVKQYFAALLNDSREEEGNGKSKTELVFILSGIDDEGRFTVGDALTKAEYVRLDAIANKVKKYYKAAINLRKKVKNENFGFPTLVAQNPTLTEALTYFHSKIKIVSKDNIRSEKNFWQLANIEQQTFLEASMKIEDAHLTQISEEPEDQTLLSSKQDEKSEKKEETDPLTSVHI